MHESPDVRIVRMHKLYRGKTVLADINLEVWPGERLCLVGRNGSGKSTLLEIIKGLKVATSGTVEVLGRPPLDPRLKTECAILMDRPVFPYYAKVREVVWLYGSFYVDRLDGANLLRVFELNPEAYVRHLSKGQVQRLGVVLTLLGNPKLILLDEPASGLDPQGRLLLWETLSRALEQAPGRTLIFATHDLQEAERWGARIAIIHGGKLVTVGSSEELCSAVIGTRRKVTLLGATENGLRASQSPAIKMIASLGSEKALYTDQPEEVLKQFSLLNGHAEIRIENVTLRDAYFKLTGELPDAHYTVAG